MKPADLKNGRRNPGKSSLRICLLTYRGNPTCGGQGVYIKYLSRALRELGHEVDVLSGPPYPELDEGITLHKIPGLDLYNPDHLFKVAKDPRSLLAAQSVRISQHVFGGIPGTLHLRVPRPPPSASGAGTDTISSMTTRASPTACSASPRSGYPTVATIHHPITVDRDTEIACGGKLAAPDEGQALVFLSGHAEAGLPADPEDHHRLRMFEAGHRPGVPAPRRAVPRRSQRDQHGLLLSAGRA